MSDDPDVTALRVYGLVIVALIVSATLAAVRCTTIEAESFRACIAAGKAPLECRKAVQQ